MARQRPTRLIMGPCIVEIDCIVIRKVQYQFEVNRCRNEEFIVKGNFGWAWSMWARAPQVEIDRIVIREVQYQFEVNRCRNEEFIVKGNFGWVWSMWARAPQVEIDRIVIRDVQYQFEVNRCRNEEFIGAPGLVMGPCIVEIDRIVIREVQYQFEVNRCRNEEFIVKGNCGWAAPGLVMGPCIYQFEVNLCRNEEVIVKGNCGWAWSMWAGRRRIDRTVIRDVQYQFEFQGSSAYTVGGDSGHDGRTAEITTISPRFSKSMGIKILYNTCTQYPNPMC
ncbi:hypothetical protein DPMN_001253 [Dreissena polymorpha]|uniref:Uncharacterized protein n=1 Tax=Dreissena polymorpha TaxID=45954 RepID=A0A9D4MJ06_DREPO|nr:hypothetical protein DPMN_001253 [Dreissena polymorpha]